MSRSTVGSPPPSGDALTPARFPPGFGAGRCAKTVSEKNAGEKKRAAKRRHLVARKTMTNSTGWRDHQTTAVSYTAVLHSGSSPSALFPVFRLRSLAGQEGLGWR